MRQISSSVLNFGSLHLSPRLPSKKIGGTLSQLITYVEKMEENLLFFLPSFPSFFQRDEEWLWHIVYPLSFPPSSLFSIIRVFSSPTFTTKSQSVGPPSFLLQGHLAPKEAIRPLPLGCLFPLQRFSPANRLGAFPSGGWRVDTEVFLLLFLGENPPSPLPLPVSI